MKIILEVKGWTLLPQLQDTVTFAPYITQGENNLAALHIHNKSSQFRRSYNKKNSYRNFVNNLKLKLMIDYDKSLQVWICVSI